MMARSLFRGTATLFDTFRAKALFCLLLVSVLAPLASSAAERTDQDKRVYQSEMQQADQKIYDEVKAHSELMKNLESSLPASDRD